MTKWVYSFGDERAEGRAEMKNLLGGKGANLAEMASLGLPVPPGFTITTEVCTYFYANGNTYPVRPRGAGRRRARRGRPPDRPRIRRRGQPAAGLGALRGARLDARHDGHRPQPRPQRRRRSKRWPGPRATRASPTIPTAASSRCIRTSCSASTSTISRTCSSNTRKRRGYSLDTDLTARGLARRDRRLQGAVVEETGKPFPQDPRDQLWGAIGAVFASWMNQRAITYRRLNDIPAEWGTAVNVQAMVFGNMGETSATGVAFTRNPVDRREGALRRVPGQRAGRGRGRRHPHAAEHHRGGAHGRPFRPAVARSADADVFGSSPTSTELLEKHYRDMQDLEFTIERGKLWMLQTRNGKRTAKAALKIAVDMADEGLIAREEAVVRIDPGRARPAAAPDHRPEGASRPSSPPACPPRPARPAARSCSPPTRPRRCARPGEGHPGPRRDAP